MTWTAEQQAIIDLINSIGQARGVPSNVLRAAMSTGYVESRFRNVPCGKGDRDSCGVMQQRPSQGWGTPAQVSDPVYAINKFYDEALKRASISDPGKLAQAVQRSGFPDRYGQALSITDQLLTGEVIAGEPTFSLPQPGQPSQPGQPASSTDPGTIEVKIPGENLTLPLILAAAVLVVGVALK